MSAGPPHWVYSVLNMAVGLKSVAQLTLYVHFSWFRGITEVYNLLNVEDPNDHFVIPGTD